MSRPMVAGDLDEDHDCNEDDEGDDYDADKDDDPRWDYVLHDEYCSQIALLSRSWLWLVQLIIMIDIVGIEGTAVSRGL